MDSDTSRMTGSMLLLLSLLIHILLLLFLFLFQTPTHETYNPEYSISGDEVPSNQTNQQQQQQQQNQQDDPNAPPYEPDHEILIELLPQGIAPNNTMVDDPGELTPAISAPSKQEDTQDDTPQEDLPASDEGEKEGSLEESSDQEQIEEPVMKTPVLEQPQSIADLVSGLHALAQAQKQPEPARPKQKPKKIVRKLVKRSPMRAADTRMLSKIAQGFVESMAAERGNQPSNDPTQLAHQRYMTKLSNHLRQSINAEDNVHAFSTNVDTDAVLVMTIDKQGKLINALLRHPNKTNDILKIENIFLTGAKNAGLFPPLPTSFNQNEVTFAMPIRLRAQAGVHGGYHLQVGQ